jgi:phenylalanyl-tRNA synthetase alpha chain
MDDKNLENIHQEALDAIEKVDSEQKLNEVRSFYMGKKSPLAGIMKEMAQLAADEKKKLGQAVNQIKSKIEEALELRRTDLEKKDIERKLKSETIDVTLPGKKVVVGSLHPLMQVIEELEDIFVGMGYSIVDGPEVEEDTYNFEMLNVPKNHPARDMQDSFYITDNYLMRTQTSSMQARTLLKAKGQPVKIIAPGKTYRRDDDDATHSHQFTQLEGLVVDTNISMSDLKGTLELVMQKMFGASRDIRFRPSYFPFTEPSVEVDVSCFKCGGKGCSICKGSGWIEILGAGMVHPNVLKAAGYDTTKYRGFAFGIGMERVAMLRHGIDDIRNFYLNDNRFLEQFKGDETK